MVSTTMDLVAVHAHIAVLGPRWYDGGMARRPDPKPDDPDQYQRFRELAEELEAQGAKRPLSRP